MVQVPGEDGPESVACALNYAATPPGTLNGFPTANGEIIVGGPTLYQGGIFL